MNHKGWAYSLLRFAIGINFCGHGFVRMFHGIGNFASGTANHLAASPLPQSFIYAYGCFIPVFEAVFGVLLVLGLFTRTALAASALFIITLTAGVTSIQDWSTAGQQLLYSVVFFLLLFLVEYNTISLDSVLKKKRAES